MKSDLDAKIKECIESQKEAEDAKRTRDALQASNDTLQKAASAHDTEMNAKTKEHAEVQKAAEDAIRTRDALQAKTKECAEIQKEIEDAKRTRDALQVNNDALQKTVSAGNHQIKDMKDSFQREYETLKNEMANVEKQRDNLQGVLNSGPEIAVYSACWGDRQFGSQDNVVARIRGCAANNQGFRWTNDFFENDPKPGVRKFGSIVYQKRGKQVVSLCGWENDTSTFT